MTLTSSNKYVFIDYFKLFCAFLVVCIHTEPFGDFALADKAFAVLTRIAVPYFFVITAFFLFSGGISRKRCVTYCKRIFILYFVWSAIYFAARYIVNGTADEGMLKDFFVSGYLHLWFLQASIVAAVIMTVLIKLLGKKHGKWIIIITSALFAYGCLISTYAPLTTRLGIFNALYESKIMRFTGTRNGIYYAPVFFAMGWWFANNEKRVPLKTCVIGIMLCFASLAAEGLLTVMVLNTDQTILFFSAVPLTWFICNACFEIKVKNEKLIKYSAFVRKCTTGIYCVHPLVILLAKPLVHNRILLTAAVFILAFALSAAYYGIKLKKPAEIQ